MIGFDTNVLVRYIMQDDVKPSLLASLCVESLSAEATGFVPLVAVVELASVLSSAYELNRAQLVEAFEGLLRTKELVVDRAETVWKALHVFQRGNANFADSLIERAAASSACDRTVD